MSTTTSYIKSALRTIDLEKEAVDQLKSRIDDDFSHACELILQCSSRLL